MNKALKFTRLSKGIKQKDLAKRAGITQTYLSALENGNAKNPSKSIMDNIANELGSNVQTLFYDKEED